MADPSQLMSMPQQASDALSPLYYLIGSQIVLSVITAAVGVVRWLAGRTVEREDKDKEALTKRVEAIETEAKKEREALAEKYDERFEELEDQLNSLDKAVSGVANETKQVRDTLESIRGGVSELKLNLDGRLEKQATFYRDTMREYVQGLEKKLEELEYKLRQDMTRAVGDVMRETQHRAGRRKTD